MKTLVGVLGSTCLEWTIQEAVYLIRGSRSGKPRQHICHNSVFVMRSRSTSYEVCCFIGEGVHRFSKVTHMSLKALFDTLPDHTNTTRTKTRLTNSSTIVRWTLKTCPAQPVQWNCRLREPAASASGAWDHRQLRLCRLCKKVNTSTHTHTRQSPITTSQHMHKRHHTQPATKL